MNVKLSQLAKQLESLKDTIEKATFTTNGFQAHGWNQVHLHKTHINNLIFNLKAKVTLYGSAPITEHLDSALDIHIESIKALDTTAKSHFTDQAQHLIHIVPSIILTILTISEDIEHELFSYENIQDKKLLPRNLAVRIRGAKARLDSIDDSSADLKKKIGIINDAHEAAESLPTDLESLKDARKELTTLIAGAKKELIDAKTELQKLKEEAVEYRSAAKIASENAELLKDEITLSAETASSLVEQCDNALQITTTQGLAAGFDQKAVQLKNSIWIWILGLLIALGTGAWIGADRVDAFTQVIDKDLTAGQAILHTIMSIFSIGGPLWLAWISTQQINQRFKLSEDYFYKATVAKSFTGFRKFAERFDTETEERLFNSTLDRFDEMPLRLLNTKDYNSPWHDFIDSEAFKSAVATFPALLSEAGRFASKVKLKNSPKVSKAPAQAEHRKVTPLAPSETPEELV